MYGFDNLFSFSEAWKAFRKYFRRPITKESESLFTASAVFDAVITEVVDSFQGILRDNDDDERYVGEKVHGKYLKLQDRASKSQKKYVRFVKGSDIPHESAICLKALVPKATINLHNSCFELFKSNVELSSNQLQAELSVKNVGSEEEKLDN